MHIETKEIDATMWADVEAALGPNGGDEGCWCMGWRSQKHLPPAEAKDALRNAVEADKVYARIAYVDGQPVAWCTFGPRHTFYHAQQHLKRATEAPLTEADNWCIPCFFIQPSHRGKGLSQRLLQDVLESIQARGGRIVEGYPFDAEVQDDQSKQDGDNAADWAFTGSKSTFARQGFAPSQYCANGCLHVMVKSL